MFAPHRRHSKASPKPNKRPDTPPKESSDDYSAGGSGGGGGGFFAQARRRWGRSHKESDTTLLPTTYASSSYKNSSPARSPLLAPITAKTCNSFLMGGHYYPGKDKKRRHMRRRTLWYKVFCSSPWRKMSSFFLALYLLFWHGIVPFGGWLLQLGAVLSSSSSSSSSGIGDSSSRGVVASLQTNNNWLQYDSTLVVPKLAAEQVDRLQTDSERARLQFGALPRKALRNKILEEIAPAWYHRNDPKGVDKNSNQQPSKPQADAVNKKIKASKRRKQKTTKHDTAKSEKGNKFPSSKTENSVAEKPLIEKTIEEPNETTQQLTNSKIVRMTGPLSIRTIHNMDAFATSNQSSCASISMPSSLEEWKTTLVTQTTANRLWILKETCARWKNPIVAVVFVPISSSSSEELPNADDLLVKCPHVTIIQYTGSEEESKWEGYPVNRLRNIGLDAVNTSHILVLDIDFVPSFNLHETIHKGLKHQHEVFLQGNDDDINEYKEALIVPAFERQPPKPCETESDCAAFLQSNSSFIPNSFDNLKECFLSNECTIFQRKVNWEGHYSTRTEEWVQREWYDDEDTGAGPVGKIDGQYIPMRRISCFHTARYEPYVVLRWCGGSNQQEDDEEQQQLPQAVAPYYDERFHGYGKNKIELVSHLRKSGYQFSVLPEGFIVHNPHPESSIKETWNDKEGSELHGSMDSLYSEFLKELETKYKDVQDSTIKLCKHQ